MPEETLKYLKSETNNLNIGEAASKKAKGWQIWMEDDGTWSAVWLVSKPIQPGQKPWVGNDKPTLSN